MTIKPVTKKDKLLNRSAFITLLMAVSIIVYIFYLCLWPVRTIDYKNVPFPVLEKTIKAGEDVKYQVDYCRYTKVPTKALRTLSNEVLYTLPETEVRSPVGCHTTISTLNIPKGIIPGRYKIVIIVSWKVNELRTITKEVETEYFNVQ